MRTIYLLLILILIFFSCSDKNEIIPEIVPEIIPEIIPKNCEELKARGVIDSFPYPCRPGSIEWVNLGSLAERLKAVNVPEDTLQNMCTHGLVYTCVYCPYFFELTIHNHIRNAFTTLSGRINSFAELPKRDDAGKELFDYYKTLLPGKLNTTWHFQTQIYHTEIFFAQQEYLSKLNNTELQEVLIEAYNKLKEKEENIFYESCIYGSYYLMSNIEYHNLHYEPLIDFIDRNDMSPFLNDFRWGWFDNQTLDSLKYYTELYILEFLQ